MGDNNLNFNIIGDVQGKTCIIMDDIMFSGSTIIEASHLLKLNGANKIIGQVTHNNLSEVDFDEL